MLLTTSVLKSGVIPDKFPMYGYIEITFSTTTYVFVGEEPDMNYEATADIIGSTGMSVKIPKRICSDGEIHLWQTSGADAYAGIVEVVQ